MIKTITFSDTILNQAYQKIISEFGDFPEIITLSPKNYFPELAETIIGQQLSGKAANSIIQKVKNIMPNHTLEPNFILALDNVVLRDAGLSNSKVNYIKNLAQYYLNNKDKFLKMNEMLDEQVISFLTEVKGIGKWTAEMFLIFGLGRPDVFSLGDLGLKKGAIKVYNLPEDVSKDDLLKLSENWKPYRSLASRILWKSLELK